MKTDTIKSVLIALLIACLIGIICTSCTKQNPDPCGCMVQYNIDNNAKNLDSCQMHCKH